MDKHLMCTKPDRDVPKLVCGHPMPCPYHTVIIEDSILDGHKAGRRKITEQDVDDIMDRLKVDFLARLHEKGFGVFASEHECLGVITEEFHELVEAVRQNDRVRFESECVDIAIASIFSLMSDSWSG